MENIEKTRKKVGVAVSGGWIRAMAAIGVIEVLEENNVPIDFISGCSAGGGVAAAYAAGNLEKLRSRFRKGTWKEYWQIIFEPTLPKEGILKGRRTREFFKEFVGEKDFSDLNKKLFIAVTDLKTLCPVIIEKGKVTEAIQASVSVPGMFVPIKDDENRIFADGGNFSLIPSEVLYKNGADYVIATDFTQSPNFFNKTLGKIKKKFGLCNKDFKICEKKPNIFRLIWRAASLSSTKIDNFYSHSYHYDILIKPDIANVRRWHINKVDYLIQQGRQAALRKLNQIKNDLEI